MQMIFYNFFYSLLNKIGLCNTLSEVGFGKIYGSVKYTEFLIYNVMHLRHSNNVVVMVAM